MKKITLILSIFTINIFLFACQSQEMPRLDYPLDSDTITSAIEDSGYPWHIDEVQRISDESISFIIRNDADKIVAVIDTVKAGQEQGLAIIFSERYEDDHSIKEDGVKDMISLAIELYGGFQYKNQLYNNFVKEYDTKNTTASPKVYISGKEKTLGPEERVRWEKRVDGKTCQIVFSRAYPNLPERQNLYMIRIMSDKETFFPEKIQLK